MKRPADVILLIETSNQDAVNDGVCAANDISLGMYVAVPYSVDYKRHNNGLNVTYCDGHAKWARWEQVSTERSWNVTLD